MRIVHHNSNHKFTGCELIKQLKSNPKTAGIKTLLLSTHPDLPGFAGSCETDAYLAKPFDNDELVQVVTSFFSHLQ